MDNKENILACWKCGKEMTKYKKDYVCRNCGEKYLLERGIVVATKNEEVEQLRKAKPNWYVKSQQKARDIYKHQHDKRRILLLDSLERIMKEKRRKDLIVLDIGCGDGVSIQEMKKFNPSFKLYGVDYNHLRLLRARKINPSATLILSDANKDAIKSESCDVILLNHVLEHVPDDVGLLKKMYSYLKPGGYALIGIPQEGTFICKMRNYVLEPYMMFITDHVHFYTDKEVKAKIKRAKFEIKEFEYLNYHFPHSVIDRHLRKSKKVHDFMERTGAKYFKVGGAGALWIVLKRPGKKR